jgi:NodT family efflux transporter outer membrane factor (OMF) lipoprotein
VNYSLQSIKMALGVLAAALLAACAVGPDFRTPEAPVVAGYLPQPLPVEIAGVAGADDMTQRFVSGRDIAREWWTLFQSEPLDRLIRQALADSPTMAAARARLREAEENLRARGGSVYFPSVDGEVSVVRRRTTGAAFAQPELAANTFTLYNASVAVSYTFDLFGGNRRELEALRATVDQQRFLLEGAHVALAANIVTTVVQEAAQREQIRVTREIIALLEKQQNVVNRQFDVGVAAQPDVLAQRAQVALVRSTLPALENGLAQTRHLLAVLVGKFPAEGGLPTFLLDDLHLPVELPISLPSELVRQRPDVRAAEEVLHAACANVGVATANMLPKITLSGSLGTSAVNTADLLSSGASLWGLSAGLLQPLFHGGELSARRRGAIAAHDQALAQYRETVLQSFRNVADTLQALDSDGQTLRSRSEAESAASDLLQIAQRKYQLGAVDYLTLLDAERQYQEARLSLVAARAARFADTAALFQALGGGWWHTTAAATP